MGDSGHTKTETCPVCHGTGYMIGSWSEQKKCFRCDGKGTIVDDPDDEPLVGGA